MLIKMIPYDYIINATMECMGTLQSDFVIKAICIKNDSSESIVLEKIAFDILSEGRKIKEICYNGEALEMLLANFPQKVIHLGDWDSKVMIGVDHFWDARSLSNNQTLQPGEETGIVNEFFLVVNRCTVDELILSISFLQGDERKVQRQSIPVVVYKTKNSYTFPVKGVWQVNGNYDCIGAHRTQYSMEFAFDLVQMNSNGMLTHKQDMEDEDYVAYGKDILAIADGIVVDCYNNSTLNVGFPHNNNLNAEEQALRDRIINEVGMMPIQCGNYVILKHENDEYSLYGHMLYHSLTVKKGDLVRQGQVIGHLGNTGKSGCPHLHFQLMSGPSYLTSRGLPCHFTNIVDAADSARRQLDIIKEEYTLVFAI